MQQFPAVEKQIFSVLWRGSTGDPSFFALLPSHRMAKTAIKTRKKPALKEEAPQPLLEPRIPIYGERVRRSGSDMEYEVTYVSPDNTYVNIGIPRTNFEHRHVAVSARIFLEEPAYNIEAIEERLAPRLGRRPLTSHSNMRVHVDG